MDIIKNARINMVHSQLHPMGVTNKNILEVMGTLPRHLFVPEEFKAIAYADCEIPLVHGRVMLKPANFARMVEAAKVKDTDSVLVIGCAMGYSAAVLASLAAKVVVLEEDTELSSRTNSILHNLNIDNAIVISGKMQDGHPEGAPYDVIFIDGAVEEIPLGLAGQLAENGRIVSIVAENNGIQHAVKCTKKADILVKENLFEASAEILPGFTKSQQEKVYSIAS